LIKKSNAILIANHKSTLLSECIEVYKQQTHGKWVEFTLSKQNLLAFVRF
jgi:hypothetical protein